MVQCFGFCFESNEPQPARVKLCHIKNSSKFLAADLSSSNHCSGTTTPSDCPFNLYRTSGDIRAYWDRLLSNLASTVPFLGDENNPIPRSWPGAWAYPGRLEVREG